MMDSWKRNASGPSPRCAGRRSAFWPAPCRGSPSSTLSRVCSWRRRPSRASSPSPLIPLWGRVLGWVEEWRARALLPEGRDEPPPGWRDAKRWMWRVLTWRQTALVLVNASAGFLVFFLITAALTAFVCSLRLAAGLGVRIGGERIVLAGLHPAWATIALSLLAVACNVLLVYALVACALAQAWVSRGLFRADTEAMERQITLLSQRNLGLVEAFEAERQRIERELHDGAQQHLASAAIQLGLAQAGLAGRSAADGHLEADRTSVV